MLNQQPFFESLNEKKFQKLTEEETTQIHGGWKLFGWEVRHPNQTLLSIGGVSSTGFYGTKYFMGIVVDEGYVETDQKDNSDAETSTF